MALLPLNVLPVDLERLQESSIPRVEEPGTSAMMCDSGAPALYLSQLFLLRKSARLLFAATVILAPVPYLTNGTKDVRHFCGSCGTLVAVWLNKRNSPGETRVVAQTTLSKVAVTDRPYRTSY